MWIISESFDFVSSRSPIFAADNPMFGPLIWDGYFLSKMASGSQRNRRR
jgi:hypothetical protein